MNFGWSIPLPGPFRVSGNVISGGGGSRPPSAAAKRKQAERNNIQAKKAQIRREWRAEVRQRASAERFAVLEGARRDFLAGLWLATLALAIILLMSNPPGWLSLPFWSGVALAFVGKRRERRWYKAENGGSDD